MYGLFSPLPPKKGRIIYLFFFLRFPTILYNNKNIMLLPFRIQKYLRLCSYCIYLFFIPYVPCVLRASQRQRRAKQFSIEIRPNGCTGTEICYGRNSNNKTSYQTIRIRLLRNFSVYDLDFWLLNTHLLREIIIANSLLFYNNSQCSFLKKNVQVQVFLKGAPRTFVGGELDCLRSKPVAFLPAFCDYDVILNQLITWNDDCALRPDLRVAFLMSRIHALRYTQKKIKKNIIKIDKNYKLIVQYGIIIGVCGFARYNTKNRVIRARARNTLYIAFRNDAAGRLDDDVPLCT